MRDHGEILQRQPAHLRTGDLGHGGPQGILRGRGGRAVIRRGQQHGQLQRIGIELQHRMALVLLGHHPQAVERGGAVVGAMQFAEMGLGEPQPRFVGIARHDGMQKFGKVHDAGLAMRGGRGRRRARGRERGREGQGAGDGAVR